MITCRIAGGVLAIRFWPLAMTCVMLVALLGLGTWQVQRLHWKQNLIATINQRIHQAPVDIATIADTGDAAYRPATASGIFRHDHSLYLFAISQTAEGGYHLLTPLELKDGRYLLVDRGWVPYAYKKDETAYARPVGVVTVTGLLRQPEYFLFQPENNPAGNDWYRIDFAAMAKAAGVPAFLPYVLEADATPNPGGYPIGGQTRVTLPNNHFIYAVTWYGLAFALVIIYALSAFRKKSAD